MPTAGRAPVASEVRVTLPVLIAKRTMPNATSRPFSPVTVIVTGSFALKVPDWHENESVPPAETLAGETVQESTGG